jgi:DNA-binding transcriptional MerR regulator
MSESDLPSNSTGTVYTIETVARITRISPDRIVFYHEHGLVPIQRAPGRDDLLFDDEAIHQLRRVAYLASEFGLDHRALKMVTSLLHQLERLREEVRFLRK